MTSGEINKKKLLQNIQINKRGNLMQQEQKDKLIVELNQILKNVATCDESEINQQGDNIRAVFFTILEQKLNPEEIEKVFDGVEITDEKIKMIEENDSEIKR